MGHSDWWDEEGNGLIRSYVGSRLWVQYMNVFITIFVLNY